MSSENRVPAPYLDRLVESAELIERGHFRSAVESASGGVEMLMQFLYQDLIEDLLPVDTILALGIMAKHDLLANSSAPKGKLTFGEWIKLYEDEDIIDELCASFGYQLLHFSLETIRNVNILRNRCAHENYQPTETEARHVRDSLQLFVREAERMPTPGDRANVRDHWTAEWLRKWESLINAWLKERADSPHAKIIAPLVDQLMLVVGLVGDSRVSLENKAELSQAIVYVVEEEDVISEATEGVGGLIDDSAVIAMTLHWFMTNGEAHAGIVDDHWAGLGDPRDLVREQMELLERQHATWFADEAWRMIAQIAVDGPKSLHKSWAPESPDISGPAGFAGFLGDVTDSEAWLEIWRDRIARWRMRSAGDRLAHCLVQLPDLFTLVMKLTREPNLPAHVRARLIAAATYVLIPTDMIPEALLGVPGLADDVSVLAVAICWLTRSRQLDRDMIQKHSPNQPNLISAAASLFEWIAGHPERVFRGQTRVWNYLLSRFGGEEIAGQRSIMGRIRLTLGRSESP